MKLRDLDFFRECLEDVWDNQDDLSALKKNAFGWQPNDSNVMIKRDKHGTASCVVYLESGKERVDCLSW